MRKKTKPKETNFDSSNHHHQHQHQHQLMPSLTYDCDVKLKEHQSSWIPIDSHECKIGIYGWRKKFLYILIVIITATVIINGALTLWIIMMLNISFNKIGNIHLTSDGIVLDGNAFINGKLFASSISSRQNENIKFQSINNITLISKDQRNHVINKLFIGDSHIEVQSNKFTIKGPNGHILFQVNDEEVSIATETLKLDNQNGFNFNASIQTALVIGNAIDDLKLISPARKIHIVGPLGVGIVSRFGDIQLMGLKDLRFKAKQGKITLESSNIILSNLKTAFPSTSTTTTATSTTTTTQTTTSQIGKTNSQVYQLCSCANNGKIFMVPSNSSCIDTNNICNPFKKRIKN